MQYARFYINHFEFFRYISKWLLHKRDVIAQEESLTDEEKQQHTLQMVEAVISHIRMGMMTPKEIALFILMPVVNLHKSYFFDRMAIGMSFHAGHEDVVAKIRNSESGALQFTPRLYTNDVWGLSMTVNEFEKIINYEMFVACFFSQSNLAEYNQEGNIKFILVKYVLKMIILKFCFVDPLVAWEVDFFPRGIRFNRAKLINVYTIPTAFEIPETCLRTVRLRVTCRENFRTDQKFKVMSNQLKYFNKINKNHLINIFHRLECL